MMADLVVGVRAALLAQGLAVDVRDGAEVPAQDLEASDPVTGLPLPRVVFIENGEAGNLMDRYDGPDGAIQLPGKSVEEGRLYVGFMTRIQSCEMRVWGFDATTDASGQNIATPAMHRAAVNKLLNWTDGTGILSALYAVLRMAKFSWTPKRGHFDNAAKDIKFGALYVFEFDLPVPCIARRVAIATPLPNVAVKAQGS
jgi:hypothetical protein